MIRLKGIITNGKIIPENHKKHHNLIRSLEGKEIVYTIEEWDKASKSQHGYYRALIDWLRKNTETFGGWTHADVHRYLAGEFCSQVIESGNVQRIYIPSFSTITKKKMTEFLEEVLPWLTENVGEIPSPEDFALIKYERLPGQTTEAIDQYGQNNAEKERPNSQ